MTNKQIFIEEITELLRAERDLLSHEAQLYFETLKAIPEKAPFTDNGAKIMIWMQENKDRFPHGMKANNIAEGLFMSPKSVSGSMRRLVTDGYVEKVGANPAYYSLTEQGASCEVPEVSADSN